MNIRHWVAVLISGIMAGINAITLSFSVAVLVFSGPLASQVGIGIGLALFSSIVIGLFVCFGSSYRGMVAHVQEVPGVILAIMAGAIVAGFPDTTSAEAMVPTVVAAIALSSLVTGALYWLLARLRMGGLVRFIPYPVIGGFLAATGWILVIGGIEVCASLTDSTHGASSWFNVWFSAEALLHWLPGLAVGLLLFLITRRFSHYLIMPGFLLGVIAIFYLLLGVSGISADEASSKGWLLQAPEGELLQLMVPTDWQQVNWSILLEQLPNMMVLLVLSVINMLLYLSGIELSIQRNVDFDHELRITGLGHLLAGLGGGMPGHHAISMSTLSHSLGAHSRFVGVCGTLVIALPLVFSADLVTIFPKVLLGGLLIYLGLDFLYTWLWRTVERVPLSDYLTILLILTVSIAFGFLEGIGVGLIITVILFVLRYLRISVVKNEFSGALYHSRMERSLNERHWLREQGKAIVIFQLQGFIFFGTGQRLLDHWLNRKQADESIPVRYLILDCHLVTGFDSSALLSLRRLAQLTEQQDVQLILSTLSPAIEQLLIKEELDNVLQRFNALDAAVEWCENQLLQNAARLDSEVEDSLAGQLRTYLNDAETLRQLLAYFTRHQLKSGSKLIRQGDIGDEMLLIESGQVTVRLETDEGADIRIRSMRAGSIVGEIGLFRNQQNDKNQQRVASVIADSDVVVYSLNRAELVSLEREAPELANALHRAMLALMAERLVDTTALVRTLTL